jgi:hypothetical protein
MSVVHRSRLRIEKHEGPHRTAHLEGLAEPIHFGVHSGIKQFYEEKYGRGITGPEYPATLDHIIAGVMPYAHDQPDNAERVRRLGIARTISRSRYTPDRAATELRELLDNPTYAPACDALEGLLQNSPARR